MSVPDPLGRDRLATGAAMYRTPVYGATPPAKPFYQQRRYFALVVVVGVLASILVNRMRSAPEQSPQAAATRAVTLFLAADYGKLRGSLCKEDRSQVATNDLETAGRSAGPLLKALDHPTVDRVTDVTLAGSYAGVPAKQVSGSITAKVGAGTTFTVVTVHEGGGWRVCLSPGGYALGALDLAVPLGGDPAPVG